MELTKIEAAQVVLLVEGEVRSLRSLYPNSTVMLVTTVSDALLKATLAVAVIQGIVVLDLRSSMRGGCDGRGHNS